MHDAPFPEGLLADQLEQLARDIREGRAVPVEWATKNERDWLGKETGAREVTVVYRAAADTAIAGGELDRPSPEPAVLEPRQEDVDQAIAYLFEPKLPRCGTHCRGHEPGTINCPW